MQEIFEILLNAIVKLVDLQGNDISYNTLQIKSVKSPKSKVFSNILYIDGEPCKGKKRNYTVYYKCRCGKIQHILLQKYLKKTKLSCHYCSQKKEFGELGHNNSLYVNKNSKHTRINYDYDNEPIEFKQKYEMNHLSIDEFYNWLPKIIKIDNTSIKDIKNIKYLPIVVCNNQSRYTSKVLINDELHSFYNVQLKCDICGKLFNAHVLNLKNKNIDLVKCRECSLTNTRFPITKYNNSNLTYQSSIEKLFLDRCFEKNIKVLPGIKIPYKWNNKMHTYNSDYYLPEYNYIIELKSNNIYYRMQLSNGKLNAKNNAAKKYAKEHNKIFIFLFDNEIEEFFTHLNEGDILNLQETIRS